MALRYLGRAWLVLGCWAITASTASAQSMPAWMSQPPADEAQSWYGTGEGPDLSTAQRYALRAVAAKLRVSIEGAIKSVTRSTSSNGKEQVLVDATSSIGEAVAKTDFTRYELAQSGACGQGVCALVKVDRPAFVADTRNQIEVVAKPVAEAEAALPSQTPLDRFLSLRRLKPQIQDGLRLSFLLQGAGAEDEGRSGVRHYAGLLITSADLGTKLSFELRAAPSDGDIAAVLAAFLSEQGMRSSMRPMAGANVVTIASSGREASLFGSSMLKLSVHLAVLDSQGRAAATREFELPGSSRFDFKGAREDALHKLAAQLRQEGPVAGLGFGP